MNIVAPDERGRCLITTADERGWTFDRPVLFLGQWCCRYSRRSVWQAMDAAIAAPYGLEQQIRDRDHKIARDYELSLFPELCEVLNRYHGTNHGHRYWRILLGHWFRRYVEMLINRYQTLSDCLEAYLPNAVTVFLTESKGLTAPDSYTAIWKFSDDDWNSQLYSRLLEYSTIPRLLIEPSGPFGEKEAISPATEPTRDSLRQIVKSVARKVLNLGMHLSRDEDAVIFNSYLPLRLEISLSLSLGQVPQRLGEQGAPMFLVPVADSERRRLSGEISGNVASGLDHAVRSLIFELIPVCFLEGYAELVKAAAALPWPRTPKFIFTSNNFDTDELFKAWTAEKVESAVPYFVGQHGNNYGTSRYMNPSIEEITADKFITWGWDDGLPQHVPGFIFKTSSRPGPVCNKSGGLLLIELHAAQMASTWDSVAEHSKYFDEQFQFVECLQSNTRAQLIVRLHHTLQSLGWDEAGRWKEFDTAVQLETGETHLSDLISDCRIVVYSYDSTGILECLAQNIPTLAFWQNGFGHLRESAIPYYQLLIDVKILHLTPQSAAAHVNSIWDNVNAWWNSSLVQEARAEFCNRYAKSSKNPVKDLKSILMKGI